MKSEVINKLHRHLVRADVAHQEDDHDTVVDALVACVDLCEEEAGLDLSKVKPVPVPGTFADGISRAHSWVHYEADGNETVSLVLVARICLWLAEREGWSAEDKVTA